MLERWTRGMIRRRAWVLATWLVILVAGTVASGRLTPLLATSFAVPGTESERARVILADGFGERPESTFTVVVPVDHPRDERLQRLLHARLVRAAALVPTGKAGRVRDGTGIIYGTVTTALELHEAKAYTDDLRRSLARSGASSALVTGQPAIQRDLGPIVAADLRRGEVLALAVALAVLLLVLGVSGAVLLPFAFAACSIAGTLGLLWLIAPHVTMATYVTNLVELIGLGLAIDYSLLVVLRFREELERHDRVDEAIVRTISTAGRTVLFSGTAVAIGLSLLLLVPVPFVRSMGVGGLLIPLVSMAALLTLQPALLSLAGRRGTQKLLRGRARHAGPAGPPTASEIDRGHWARIAVTVMRRPAVFLATGLAVLVVAALPAVWLSLTPGSLSGIPAELEASRGYDLLRRGIGPGVVTPTSVVVDTGRRGGANRADVREAIDRLGDRLFQDFDLLAIGSGEKPPYVDPTRRYVRLIAAGREEYGAPETRAFVRRLRASDIPAARFPVDTAVAAGGAPPQGVDFLDTAYAAFPWIVLAALVATYLVLLRAFRSLVIPLKAVLLNALTVAAVYGLLVVLFQWGVGDHLPGLRAGEVEGWVPIFLFAVLFGLSMDYEVFMVSRMRESWDRHHDNARAIAHGLERTGRVVTAAATIMIAAFAGFVLGRVAGLQQLGVGLTLAVLLDATLVRAVLVPSAMAVLGRFNWWLPENVARVMRVQPSPLHPPQQASERAS